MIISLLWVTALLRAHMASTLENLLFAYAKRLQISCMVTFLFATQILQSHYFMPLIIFCASTVRFVSDLVGEPEDRSSRCDSYVTGQVLPASVYVFCLKISCFCPTKCLTWLKMSEIILVGHKRNLSFIPTRS